jgi:chorismate-pyruvate lyase
VEASATELAERGTTARDLAEQALGRLLTQAEISDRRAYALREVEEHGATLTPQAEANATLLWQRLKATDAQRAGGDAA